MARGSNGQSLCIYESYESFISVVHKVGSATMFQGVRGPVSYTHLDVYKRQVFMLSLRTRIQKSEYAVEACTISEGEKMSVPKMCIRDRYYTVYSIYS